MKKTTGTTGIMTEALEKLVIINGKFVIIDTEGPDTSIVVRIYPSDKKTRAQEINFIADLFSSASGGKLTVGNTTFLLSNIRRQHSCNEPALKDHPESTKMVVVKNKETAEFFLVMSEDTSIFAARKFLQGINEELFCNDESSPLTKITGKKCLFFPYFAGDLRFEVASKIDIAIIKLDAY